MTWPCWSLSLTSVYSTLHNTSSPIKLPLASCIHHKVSCLCLCSHWLCCLKYLFHLSLSGYNYLFSELSSDIFSSRKASWMPRLSLVVLFCAPVAHCTPPNHCAPLYRNINHLFLQLEVSSLINSSPDCIVMEGIALMKFMGNSLKTESESNSSLYLQNPVQYLAHSLHSIYFCLNELICTETKNLAEKVAYR